jgi:hypothetical protein
MNQGIDPLTVLDYFLGWFVEVMTHPAMVYVLGLLKVVITLLILLLAAFYAVRELMTHYALSPWRRRRYLVRATGQPTWSMEDLERWAAQLSMVRRRVRRRMDRPAHAIRIRLESTPQGRAKYTMESSWRFERVMLNPSLPGVEVTRLRPRSWSRNIGETPGPNGTQNTGPRA